MTKRTKRVPEFEELVGLLIDSDTKEVRFPDEFDMEAPEAKQRLEAAELFYRGVTSEPLPEVDEEMHMLALNAATVGAETDAARAPVQVGEGTRRSRRSVAEWVAELVYDSFGFGAVAALRTSASAVMPRLLHYRTDSFEVDLTLTEEGCIVGNVVPCGEIDFAPESLDCILFGEEEMRETPMQSNGDFYFENIQPGEYVLYLESEAIRIVVPKFVFPGGGIEAATGGT